MRIGSGYLAVTAAAFGVSFGAFTVIVSTFGLCVSGLTVAIAINATAFGVCV